MKRLRPVNIVCSLITFILLTTTGITAAEPWSFVVLCDNRASFENYREVLTFVRSLNDPAKTGNPPIDFVLACGDIDPVLKNMAIYKEVFQEDGPLYLPVMGNHEIEHDEDLHAITRQLLPALEPLIERHAPDAANYTMDWKGSRIIVLDQYSDFGKGNDRGWITEAGTAWMEEGIITATNAQHVFVAVHEPAFPRHRHLRHSPLAPAELEGWNTLVRHRDKVRALFVAHTHRYSRMRVEDPRSASASTTSLPNKPGGIYQIDTGNAGNTHGGGNTIGFVKVDVNGPAVRFREYAAVPGSHHFQIIDDWTLNGTDMASPKTIPPVLAWTGGEVKHMYQPGDTIHRNLQVESFANTKGQGYTLSWQLKGDHQTTPLIEGSKRLALKAHETATIQRFDIPTTEARSGNKWTLSATLQKKGRTIETITDEFYFCSTLDLAGEWLIRAGDEQEWADPDIDISEWATITTPQGWEKTVLPDYDGIAWYRLTFDIPEKKQAEWSKQPIGILIGAIDDADELFLNGVLVGRTGRFPPAKKTAWDQPRMYRFPADLLRRTNVIAVRVADWGGGGGIWKGPLVIAPLSELQLLRELEL